MFFTQLFFIVYELKISVFVYLMLCLAPTCGYGGVHLMHTFRTQDVHR